MRKTFITLVLAFSATVCSAQISSSFGSDFFSFGNRHIGVEGGFSGWLSSDECHLRESSSGAYANYRTTNVSRSAINPTFGLVFRSLIEGSSVSWGTTMGVGLTMHSGTVEGVNKTNSNATFVNNYSYKAITFYDRFYVMVPVGEMISINAGLGSSIIFNALPESKVTYSDGTDPITIKESDMLSMMSAFIDVMAGVDYKVVDKITLSCNFTAHLFNIFGLFNDPDVKGMRNLTNGLYVSEKLPYSLTLGITYSIDE